jgi:hypothetical protein
VPLAQMQQKNIRKGSYLLLFEKFPLDGNWVFAGRRSVKDETILKNIFIISTIVSNPLNKKFVMKVYLKR